MTVDSRRPSYQAEEDPVDLTDPELEDLREILFGHQVDRLEGELDELEQRLTERDALVAIIAPVLGDVIRRQIRDAREEMIEALYPIIGQLVVRAVSEAIRDLARNIDAQMRTSLSPRAILRRVQARASGVSGTEMALRESLPFEVAEVFLIHRETGLLLRHISHDPDASPDSDLISGMLTAIRDFAQEAFGRGQEGQLEEIQYGDRRILIEAARHAYLAVVVDGIEPAGFRAEMRDRIIGVDHAHTKTLRQYDGDATPLASVDPSLSTLVRVSEPIGMSSTQKRVLAGAVGLLAVCLIGACLAGRWAWRTVRSPAYTGPVPTALPVAIVSTSMPTLTPSATPSPSPTMTPTDTPVPTLTPTPTPSATVTLNPTATPTSTPTSTLTPTATPTPAPVMGLMTGNVWLREGPSASSLRLGVTLELGQSVEILAVFGDWYQVRWVTQAQSEATGWVPGRWVGTTDSIPARIITPTPSS
jgi:hypothetical protein